MATTTLTAIFAHVRTICEGAALAFKPTRDAFSHDVQPSGLLTDTYYLEDGGVGRVQMLTNDKAARLDRITIYVAGLTRFDGATAQADMETTLLEIERQLIQAGPDQGYHVRVDGRRVTRPHDEQVIGSLSVSVDYDLDLTVS